MLLMSVPCVFQQATSLTTRMFCSATLQWDTALNHDQCVGPVTRPTDLKLTGDNYFSDKESKPLLHSGLREVSGDIGRTKSMKESNHCPVLVWHKLSINPV